MKKRLVTVLGTRPEIVKFSLDVMLLTVVAPVLYVIAWLSEPPGSKVGSFRKLLRSTSWCAEGSDSTCAPDASTFTVVELAATFRDTSAVTGRELRTSSSFRSVANPLMVVVMTYGLVGTLLNRNFPSWSVVVVCS